MPDLERAYAPSAGRWRLARLSVAAGLVLAGATVVAAGLGGLLAAAVPGASAADGLAAAAMFLPMVLATVVLLLPASTSQRIAGIAGSALAVLGIVVSWVAGSPTPTWAPMPLPALLGGLVGTVLAAGALVTVVAAAGFPRPRTGGDLPGYVSRHQSGPRSPTGLPADGGSEDDDLQFPLDEE